MFRDSEFFRYRRVRIVFLELEGGDDGVVEGLYLLGF